MLQRLKKVRFSVLSLLLLAWSMQSVLPLVTVSIEHYEDLPQIPVLEANLKLDYAMLNERLLPLSSVAGQDRVAESFRETTSEGYC